MHLNGGQLFECHLKGKFCRNWTVGQNLNDSEKLDPVAHLHQPSNPGQYTCILP